ncbi:hypothetical protein [Legionella tunisiensis]|uniref:hypothetical protein n=1 Tax=Legionella tunisiensis TaxID=1034944 RepID=UPI0002E5C11B|nr:hypothetical protein [Legionella tunisiensis]
MGGDFAPIRRDALQKRYPDLYEQRKTAGYKESAIIYTLQDIAKGNLGQKVADMRAQADKLWKDFCKYKGVDEYSEHGQSMRRQALELCVLEKKIGNCGEFATLAFHYIQRNYSEQLAEMNLTVLGVNGSRHIVVSLGGVMIGSYVIPPWTLFSN